MQAVLECIFEQTHTPINLLTKIFDKSILNAHHLIFNASLGLLKEIDTLAEDYLNNVRTMSGEVRKEHLGKIQQMFGKSKEFGDDKVQLAMQTYEMV